MFLQFQHELTQDYIASRHVNRTIDIMRTNRGSVPVRCLRKVAAGDMSVCADTKTVRDKEGRDKRAPTMQDWVNSVNAGFKVAKLLTEVNVYDFFPAEVQDGPDGFWGILSGRSNLLLLSSMKGLIVFSFTCPLLISQQSSNTFIKSCYILFMTYYYFIDYTYHTGSGQNNQNETFLTR